MRKDNEQRERYFSNAEDAIPPKLLRKQISLFIFSKILDDELYKNVYLS